MTPIRSQAALELPFIFGIALVSLSAAIAALSWLGVLNFSSFIPEYCVLPPGFQCTSFTINEDTIRLTIQNAKGNDLVNVQVGIPVCKVSSFLVKNLPYSQQQEFSLDQCEPGETFLRSDISLSYQDSGASVKHTKSGKLSGPVNACLGYFTAACGGYVKDNNTLILCNSDDPATFDCVKVLSSTGEERGVTYIPGRYGEAVFVENDVNAFDNSYFQNGLSEWDVSNHDSQASADLSTQNHGVNPSSIASPGSLHFTRSEASYPGSCDQATCDHLTQGVNTALDYYCAWNVIDSQCDFYNVTLGTLVHSDDLGAVFAEPFTHKVMWASAKRDVSFLQSGKSYVASFDYKGTFDTLLDVKICSDNPRQCSDGLTLASVPAGTYGEWVRYSASFTCTSVCDLSPTLALIIGYGGVSALEDPYIDNVQVEEVPSAGSFVGYFAGDTDPAGDLLYYHPGSSQPVVDGTIEMWVMPEWDLNDPQEQTKKRVFLDIVVEGTTAPDQGVITVYKEGTSVKYDLDFTNSGKPTISLGSSLPEWERGRWKHIAVTWDGDASPDATVNLYLDGVLVSTTTGDTFSMSGPALFYIGHDQNTQNWANAAVDDLRVSNIIRL